jgi:hypothetical protein
MAGLLGLLLYVSSEFISINTAWIAVACLGNGAKIACEMSGVLILFLISILLPLFVVFVTFDLKMYKIDRRNMTKRTILATLHCSTSYIRSSFYNIF